MLLNRPAWGGVVSDLALSVVVPTHGGARRLPVLLDALLAQDLTEPWELLVAVDGVMDDSAAVLDTYADRLPLRVLVSAEPRGVVATLNDAFEQARGRVLVRCDDDLTPAPDFLRRHLAWHDGRADVGVVGPTRDVFPETPYAAVYGRPANRRLLDTGYGRDPGSRWMSWAANNSLHREAWARAGGFDPRFVYGQDSELGWRLSQQGVEIVLDPALEVEHRGPSTAASGRVPRAFVSGASRRLFDQIHPGARPPAAPARGLDRLWDGAVTLLAVSVRSVAGYERIGRLLDRAIPFLPDGIAGRFVALSVEAAGRSGQRHGSPDLTTYRARKAAELAAERRREAEPR
jgi:GT2 family glycosyltransferase